MSAIVPRKIKKVSPRQAEREEAERLRREAEAKKAQEKADAEAKEARLKAQEEEVKNRRLRWFREATLPELLAHLDEVRDTVMLFRNPANYSGEDANAMRNCLDSFEVVKHELSLLDFSKLKNHEESLSTFFKSFFLEAAQRHAEDVMANSFAERWKDTFSLQISDNNLKYYSVSNLLSELYGIILKAKAAQQLKDDQGTQLSLLALTTQTSTNLKIQEKLKKLNQVWAKASSLKNTVESTHFLEEAKNSYIPEAWKMYSTFESSPADVKDEADKILLQQLNLIHDQIELIIETHSNGVLEGMRTQAAFLEDKTQNMTSTKLMLTKQP